MHGRKVCFAFNSGASTKGSRNLGALPPSHQRVLNSSRAHGSYNVDVEGDERTPMLEVTLVLIERAKENVEATDISELGYKKLSGHGSKKQHMVICY